MRLVAIEHPARGRRGVWIVGSGAAQGRLGEASPLPGRSRETLAEVMDALRAGDDTLASIDFARWMLAHAERGGAPIRSQVLLEQPATAVDEALEASARGGTAFKLKLRATSDVEVLIALRRSLPEARVRVDANRGFARAEDVPWDALAANGVEWIEEPCPDASSLDRTPVPIALDESVLEAPDACLDAIERGRAVALVLKPTLLGATETLRIAARAIALGGRVVVSHAFESELARRGAEALARRIAPDEIHGLGRWAGIDEWRVVEDATPVATRMADADRTLG